MGLQQLTLIAMLLTAGAEGAIITVYSRQHG